MGKRIFLKPFSHLINLFFSLFLFFSYSDWKCEFVENMISESCLIMFPHLHAPPAHTFLFLPINPFTSLFFFMPSEENMDLRRGPGTMEEDCCLSITPTTTATQIRSLDAQAKQNLKRTANVKFDSSSDSFKTKIASRTVFKKKGQTTPKQQCRKSKPSLEVITASKMEILKKSLLRIGLLAPEQLDVVLGSNTKKQYTMVKSNSDNARDFLSSVVDKLSAMTKKYNGADHKSPVCYDKKIEKKKSTKIEIKAEREALQKNGSDHKNPVCYSKKIERKKAIETQRKAAREALQKLEESIHIYDDYDFMKDLVSLGLIPPEQLAQPDTL